MADQRNRGGKKQATGRQETAQHRQGAGAARRRAGEGQPGGPKEKSKSGRSKK